MTEFICAHAIVTLLAYVQICVCLAMLFVMARGMNIGIATLRTLRALVRLQRIAGVPSDQLSDVTRCFRPVSSGSFPEFEYLALACDGENVRV